MSDETREIRWRGIERGPYTVDRLYRALTSGEYDLTAEFFSERKKQWCPVAGFMEDFYPSEEKVQQMKDAGITKVKILGSGHKTDCPSCKSLTRKTYPIDAVPVLPPEGCKCIPWCRCIVLAHK